MTTLVPTWTSNTNSLKGALVLISMFWLSTDPDDPFKLTDETRQLGLAVCRGTAVVLVCPVDGMEPIANPFLQQE